MGRENASERKYLSIMKEVIVVWQVFIVAFDWLNNNRVANNDFHFKTLFPTHVHVAKKVKNLVKGVLGLHYNRWGLFSADNYFSLCGESESVLRRKHHLNKIIRIKF